MEFFKISSGDLIVKNKKMLTDVIGMELVSMISIEVIYQILGT